MATVSPMLGGTTRSGAGSHEDEVFFHGETVSRLLKEIHPSVFISEETARAAARFLEPKVLSLGQALIDDSPTGADPRLVASAVCSVLVQEPYRSVFLQGGQCQVRTSLLENQRLLHTDPDRFVALFPHMLSASQAKECLAPFFSSPQFESHRRPLSALLVAFDLLTWLSVALEDAVDLARGGAAGSPAECVLHFHHVKLAYFRCEELLIFLAGAGFSRDSATDVLGPGSEIGFGGAGEERTATPAGSGEADEEWGAETPLRRRDRRLPSSMSVGGDSTAGWRTCRSSCPSSCPESPSAGGPIEAPLVDCLRHLLDSGEGADMRVVADDGEIPCHRFMLVRRSRYFEARLRGTFGPEIDGTVRVKGFCVELMRHVLTYIYTDRCELRLADMSPDDMAFCVHLLDAAVYFGTPGLERLLRDEVFGRDRLLARLDDGHGGCQLGGLCEIWGEAQRMEALQWLTKRIEYLLALSLSEIADCDELLELPLELLHELLSHDGLVRPGQGASMMDDVRLVEGLVRYAVRQGGDSAGLESEVPVAAAAEAKAEEHPAPRLPGLVRFAAADGGDSAGLMGEATGAEAKAEEPGAPKGLAADSPGGAAALLADLLERAPLRRRRLRALHGELRSVQARSFLKEYLERPGGDSSAASDMEESSAEEETAYDSGAGSDLDGSAAAAAFAALVSPPPGDYEEEEEEQEQGLSSAESSEVGSDAGDAGSQRGCL